jgi:hypothetical protein
MGQSFLPSRDAELVVWSNHFAQLIQTNAAVYGLTTAQATAFVTLNTAWVNAYATSQADNTRTPSSIIAKDQAKVNMIASARDLAGIIQKFPGTTNQMRSDLGLNVPKARSPIPPPATSPTMEIKDVKNNRVTIQLRRSDGRRSMPAGVDGAKVYSFVGPTPSQNVDDWRFEGGVSRTLFTVEFPTSLEPFTKVWLTAQWVNPRQQAGVACTPVSVNLGTWLVQAVEAEEPVKIAA